MDNQLQNSQEGSGLTMRQSEIAKFLIVAHERAADEPKNLINMVKDLDKEFPQMSVDDFKTVLRNGGLGMYGMIYKLSTLQICVWIRKYLDDKNYFKSPI